MIKCKDNCILCKNGNDHIKQLKAVDIIRLKMTDNYSTRLYRQITNKSYLETKEKLKIIISDNTDVNLPYKVSSIHNDWCNFWVEAEDVEYIEVENDNLWC